MFDVGQRPLRAVEGAQQEGTAQPDTVDAGDIILAAAAAQRLDGGGQCSRQCSRQTY